MATGAVDLSLAYSVFSHLSPDAPAAWAAEFGRITKPGGAIAITVLEADFFDHVAAAKNRTGMLPCIRLKPARRACWWAEAPGWCLCRRDAVAGSVRARDGELSGPACRPRAGRYVV